MSQATPGWYFDPSNHLQERLWDGKEWVPFKVRPAVADLTSKNIKRTDKPTVTGDVEILEPSDTAVDPKPPKPTVPRWSVWVSLIVAILLIGGPTLWPW